MAEPAGAGDATASLKNDDLPALFWDEMPDNAEDNPDMAAIQAAIDESSPEERAAGFKEQGNRAMKTGLKQRKKFYLRQAIEQYSEGLALEFEDPPLRAILYSNRAQVNLLLGNNRNAMLDGHDAIRIDPTNLKAYFRAAKGALALRLYDKCREYCDAGLKICSEATIVALRAQADEEERAEARRKEEEAARQAAARGPARHLAEQLSMRNWRIGRPQFSVGDRKPRIDTNHDEVVWPVLFFYPEAAMQSDVVEDFGEHDTFAAHLDRMFGPQAPALPWDEANEYSRTAIEVYYLSNAAKPLTLEQLTEALYGGWPSVPEEGPSRYGQQAAGWVRVDEKKTLGETLREQACIVPGIPAFFVLSANTSFKTRFLEGELPLL
jgi:hypothetical protein